MNKKEQVKIVWEKISIGVVVLSLLGGCLLLSAVILRNSGEISLYVWWTSVSLFVLASIGAIFSRKRHKRIAIVGLVLSAVIAIVALLVRIDYWVGGITW